MEPQPGSPASPGTPSSSGSAKATTPFREMPTSSPSSPGSAKAMANNGTNPFVEPPPPDEPKEEDLDHGRQSSSSSASSSSSSSAASLLHPDAADVGNGSVPALTPEDEHEQLAAAAAPVEWVTWSEETPRAVDDSFSSSDSGGGAAVPGSTPTEAPLVQTMSPALDAAAAGGGFDPDRIPASVFQPARTSSVSQAEWSVASNESLFSIHGAGHSSSADLYAGGSSRSHFDYFYDEAMVEQDATKLPPVAEGTELTVPGSAGSDESAGGKKGGAAVFRRHESGSGGSSSNFSFAFPILAETSPKKKDCATAALYQPLHKMYEPPMPQPPPSQPAASSAFVEMTTEEERRRRDGWCCCGCCWFDCSAWSSCCCWCCRRRWWQCGCCQCSCPSLCRCNWCLCF